MCIARTLIGLRIFPAVSSTARTLAPVLCMFIIKKFCSVLGFGAHKDPNSTPRERNKEALGAFEIKDKESIEKLEQNSLMVTYQYGTSQKVRGQANSLPGPLLRRTKKKS